MGETTAKKGKSQKKTGIFAKASAVIAGAALGFAIGGPVGLLAGAAICFLCYTVAEIIPTKTLKKFCLGLR